MFRLIVALILVCAAAFGFAWLADRPGTVTIDWLGYRTETTAFITAVALAIAFIVGVGLVQFLRYLVHGPEAFSLFVRTRRRERGLRAIERGLVAVGAGDTQTALRAAQDAERHVGADPMTLLLRSQAAQLAGDRATAVQTFEQMTAVPETRPLGLRGLYVEATRAGDSMAARKHAEAAVAARPGMPWASSAVLAFQAGAREWDAALETIRANADNRLIDRAHAKRLRAVVLTAKAIEAETGEPARARTLAQEAHGLAPDLVPAAVIAARLLAEAGDVRKATRVIETTWKLSPHPDLAAVYTHARMGDAAQDRLRRAKALADLAPRHPESARVVAAAAMEARDFAAAKAALEPLREAPTKHVCLLFAAIADAEGDVGAVREWLSRSVTAAPDAVWIADGFIADRWAPVSPVDARLDAFEWRAPVTAAPGASLPVVTLPVVPQPPPEEPQVTETQVAALPAPAEAAAPPVEPAAPSEPAKPAEPPLKLVHGGAMPDDPGPEPKAATPEKRRRFGLF